MIGTLIYSVPFFNNINDVQWNWYDIFMAGGLKLE